MKFNMFEFLDKDNKELIHSQFIKFLLTHYEDQFYKEFLETEVINGIVMIL